MDLTDFALTLRKKNFTCMVQKDMLLVDNLASFTNFIVNESKGNHFSDTFIIDVGIFT